MKTAIAQFNDRLREHLASGVQRRGQAHFNALYDIDPDVANMIRGRYGLDPFYNDHNIPAFLKEVFG